MDFKKDDFFFFGDTVSVRTSRSGARGSEQKIRREASMLVALSSRCKDDKPGCFDMLLFFEGKSKNVQVPQSSLNCLV